MNSLETIELPETIRTIQDVLQFHRALWAEGLNYHPEEDFFNYVNTDKLDEFGEHPPSYTHEEATLRNALLDQAYAVCEAAGVDICSVGLEEFIFLVCGTWYSEEDEDDKEYEMPELYG
jgi:hypothetical protein